MLVFYSVWLSVERIHGLGFKDGAQAGYNQGLQQGYKQGRDSVCMIKPI